MTTAEKYRTLDNNITYRTKDMSEMVGRFLASDVLKTWTEDFWDEDTSEVVSISRSEMLFTKGARISPDMATKINFHILAGDITDVEVSNVKLGPVRYIPSEMLGWEVSYVIDGAKKGVGLVRAQTPEKAIKIITSYCLVYLDVQITFFVSDIKMKNCIVKAEDTMTEAGTMTQGDYYAVKTETEYYRGDDVMKQKYTYIVEASELGEAKEKAVEYAEENISVEERSETNILAKEGKPYKVDCIVPLDYCEMTKIKVNR